MLIDNATVSARCYDAAGNVSDTASITVTNIDIVKPAKPVLSPSTATPNVTGVTVTITYPADAVVKEYGFNNLTWQPYTASFEVTENCVVYARCYDEAGNRSDIGVIVVNCIMNIAAKSGTTTVIDYENSTIFGLAPGISSLEAYVDTAQGFEIEYLPSAGGFGTGTVVNLKLDGATVETYTIIIFGDVNGDGNITGIDAGILVNVENYMVAWDPEADAVLINAGDVNNDGNITGIDAGILIDVENYARTIDQSTGLAN